MDDREAYYSSDEDFAWGPLTAREVKKIITLKHKKPDRRHTACVLLPETSMDSYRTASTLDTEELKENLECSSNNLITIDLSQFNDISPTGSPTNKEIPAPCIVDISHLNMPENQELDNSTSLDISKDDSRRGLITNTNDNEFLNQISDGVSTCYLSAGDEINNLLLSQCQSSNETYHTAENTNLKSPSLNNSSEIYTKSKFAEHLNLSTNIEEYSLSASESGSKTTDYRENSTSLSGVDILSISSQSMSKLGDLTSLENSQNDSNYGEFNDTLDDINRMLEQAQSEENIRNGKEKNLSMEELPVTPVNLISGSFLSADKNVSKLGNGNSNKKGVCCDNKKKSEIPVKNLFNKPHTFKENIEHFKLPKAIKSTATPKNIKSPAPNTNFKNVISPVAVYINNTPKPCLKQNINPKVTTITPGRLFEKPFTDCSKKMEINYKSKIPEVIYKPAKETKTSYQEKVKLPESLKKHVEERKLTIHEKRIKNVDMSETFISRKLVTECDITNASIDLSNTANENFNDISILTEKQVIIERKRAV